MNDVGEVAKYVVAKGIDCCEPVTNLKLQKILYFLWLEYYNKTGSVLFENGEMEAWNFGPVCYRVYWAYRIYAARPISVRKPYSIDEWDERILNGFIDKYLQASCGDLIEASRVCCSVWNKASEADKFMATPIQLIDLVRDAWVLKHHSDN